MNDFWNATLAAVLAWASLNFALAALRLRREMTAPPVRAELEDDGPESATFLAGELFAEWKELHRLFAMVPGRHRESPSHMKLLLFQALDVRLDRMGSARATAESIRAYRDLSTWAIDSVVSAKAQNQ